MSTLARVVNEIQIVNNDCEKRCLEFEGYCKRCCLLSKFCVKR